MKKTLALLLCLCLIPGTLVGCGRSKIENYSDEEVSAAEQAAEAMDTLSDPANAHEADTVVCTLNGQAITWDEYYYWLNNYRQSVESSLGEITDWDALNARYTTSTNEQVVRALAQNDMLYYHTVLTTAEALGVAPTDEQAAEELALETDQYFGDGDGELSDEEQQAFEDYLAEKGVSYELQLLIAKEALAEQQLYASVTSEYTDEDILAWAEEQGYMAAKHILLLTIDQSTREALDEETIAEKAETADYVLAELTEAKNAELTALEAAAAQSAETTADASGEAADPAEAARNEFSEYFDKLMNEYSEDTGLASYPNGYLFLPGEMVEEFENAVLALDTDYGLSEVVESSYGYHIILRMPLDPDFVVTQNSYGYDVTLRAYALSNIFTDYTNEASAAAEYTWTEGFEEIDLAQLFATAE